MQEEGKEWCREKREKSAEKQKVEERKREGRGREGKEGQAEKQEIKFGIRK